MSDDLYERLSQERPIAPRLGGVFLTLVHAQAGREEHYNRWYEDDHFVAGAMIGPWIFAGRRFHRSQFAALRSGEDSPPRDGSFVTVYLTLDGHLDDAAQWIRAMWHALESEGRGARDREHLYSSMHGLVFEHIYDPPPMRSIHALSYPYRGLVVEFYDAPEEAGRESLINWLRDDLVSRQSGLTGQCLALVPTLSEDDRPGTFDWQSDFLRRRVCVIWLLRNELADIWPGPFGNHAEEVEHDGLGRLSYQASFIPTLPGTPTPLSQQGGGIE